MAFVSFRCWQQPLYQWRPSRRPQIRLGFTFPCAVTAGSQQLAPGDHEIRPHAGREGVFELYKRDGKQAEGFLMAMPADKGVLAPHTDIVLRNEGGGYVMDQIWIKNLSRGYEFITPETLKSRERERIAATPPASKAGL